MNQLGNTESVTDTRRTKLRSWISTHCQGLQSEFLVSCARNGYELSQSELSGLLRQKSFGEKKARAIEKGAGMPINYLDTPEVAGPLTLELREPSPAPYLAWPFKKIRPAQYELLDEDQRADIEKYVLLQIKSREPPTKEKHTVPASKSAKVHAA
ncbi:MAG: hypothetical protein CK604_00660 [Curvibacter sp. PD_MW3]|nr:MAG: hypothetical protein CK604_00660 [Curvibacter sp. PD_MW3]